MTIKKEVYEKCVQTLLRVLSDSERLNEFLSCLQNYESELLNADKLNANQQNELAEAQELLATEKQECVSRYGLTAWDAIPADSNGNGIGRAKAIVALLSGDSQARRNAFVLDCAPGMLGLGCVPKHITADGVVQLGEKTNKRNSQSNSERPSLRKVLAGSQYYWKHADVWYGIVGTSDGIRLFNLANRIELTSLTDGLPQNASAAQKLVTSWADAFRGYVSIRPDDVESLTDDELMA